MKENKGASGKGCSGWDEGTAFEEDGDGQGRSL